MAEIETELFDELAFAQFEQKMDAALLASAHSAVIAVCDVAAHKRGIQAGRQAVEYAPEAGVRVASGGLVAEEHIDIHHKARGADHIRVVTEGRTTGLVRVVQHRCGD